MSIYCVKRRSFKFMFAYSYAHRKGLKHWTFKWVSYHIDNKKEIRWLHSNKNGIRSLMNTLIVMICIRSWFDWINKIYPGYYFIVPLFLFMFAWITLNCNIKRKLSGTWYRLVQNFQLPVDKHYSVYILDRNYVKISSTRYFLFYLCQAWIKKVNVKSSAKLIQ